MGATVRELVRVQVVAEAGVPAYLAEVSELAADEIDRSSRFLKMRDRKASPPSPKSHSRVSEQLGYVTSGGYSIKRGAGVGIASVGSLRLEAARQRQRDAVGDNGWTAVLLRNPTHTTRDRAWIRPL